MSQVGSPYKKEDTQFPFRKNSGTDLNDVFLAVWKMKDGHFVASKKDWMWDLQMEFLQLVFKFTQMLVQH